MLTIQTFLVVLLYQALPYFVQDFDQSVKFGFVGLSLELLVLFIVILFFLFITDNLLYSFVLTNFLYVLFIFSGVLKIKFLKSPIVLYDFYQIDDLFPNISTIGYPIIGLFMIFCIALFVVAYLGIRSKEKDGFRKFTFFALLFCLIISQVTISFTKDIFRDYRIKYKWNSDIISKTQKHGFLPVFLQSIYFSRHLQKPENYNTEQTLEWLKEYRVEKIVSTQDEIDLVHPDNVIVLLIESFQDVRDLPWKTHASVTPTYYKMEKSGFSGRLISPVFGGKSINAEFELLTGFTHIFTPQGSMPYKDFVNKKIPSIAWQLKEKKYTTNVIQVVKMLGYGYKTIYENLGFDNKYSLHKHIPGISLDPTKRFGSSEAIARQILDILERQDKSFVFAFPNSSHAPWKLSDYPDNSINLTNQNIDKDEAEEIIAYYNALNHIDLLFSLLYQWAENSDEKTLILVIGDHQPALKARHLIKGGAEKNKIQNHTVPYLFWANYPINYQSLEVDLTSMNLVGGILLDLMQIKPTGFFIFNKTLREYYQAFSFVLIEQKSNQFSKPPASLIEHYQALQYLYLQNN